ncbi:sensor histidine kinase [Caldibacillus lycopersici]|uniref:Sensor histidine kinase n=1 Tax=Perspicuibacillus lycopersici TaxID=1325689 RepID=A0AAE3IUL9_9BACI|nr:sensor histidine kinase [Perspicuibacillus lycopersici]MCU9614492.1 sensor histidine kinase [Perspicuibacillus lycopersici]
MSTIVKKLLAHLGISLLVMLCSAALIFYTFRLENWADLWHQRLFDVPFAVMVLAIIATIGVITGVASGINDMQKWKLLEKTLAEIPIESKKIAQDQVPSELTAIFTEMEALQKQWKEQTLITQKLVSEKVDVEEKQIQAIISQERNRLARELHDSVSQQLFAASMLLSAITESTEHELPQAKQLKLVEEMIHQSQLEMRALLLHLRPVALKGKSLQEGIEELLTELRQKVPMNIQWIAEEMQLTRGVEDHLFRIVQESVSNTLRHAKATKLEVLLIERDQFIILRIVDDGVGFEVDASKSGSYGLQNMKERATEIGGTFKIVSLPGKGTRLEVKVPKWQPEGNEIETEAIQSLKKID